MIKVLVVDDHPLLRAGAVSCLARAEDIRVVGESGSAEEALFISRNTVPDVVLLDIRLKGDKTGIYLARALRAELPHTKILVLTNYTFEPYVRAMMELGVEGYIVKDTPPDEIAEAIRMVVRGRTVFSSKVSGMLRETYVRASATRPQGSVESLTNREAEVLQFLASGASNADIARRLGVSVKAVEVHLTSIYGKLGVGSRAEAIVQAVRKGLLMLDSESS